MCWQYHCLPSLGWAVDKLVRCGFSAAPGLPQIRDFWLLTRDFLHVGGGQLQVTAEEIQVVLVITMCFKKLRL